LTSTEGGKETIFEIFNFLAATIVDPFTLAALKGCTGVRVDGDTHADVA
jgi:hypothetical protein